MRRYSMLLVVLLALSSCEEKDTRGEVAGAPHPLSAAVSAVRGKLTGLSSDELTAVDLFVREAGPNETPYEVRRICGLLGKGLKDAPAPLVADFVAGARKGLYADFFRSLPDDLLDRVAAQITNDPEVGEIERYRMESIISRSRGVYSGTLAQALKRVAFTDALTPRPKPIKVILPAEGAPVEGYTGAAEVLRLAPFVADGARPDLTIGVYKEALTRWPADPVLVSGLVSVYMENEDTYLDDIDDILMKACKLDPQNAAYPYLRAVRYFLKGKDDDALKELRHGAAQPHLSFHTLERARRTADFLESRGYGPIRSRLAAYRATSAPYFDLKTLANRALQRSIEYQTSRPPEDLELVLDFPRILDRQLEGEPHTLIAEHLRQTILAAGLERLADYRRSRSASDALDAEKEAAAVHARVQAMEKGWQNYTGQEAWDRFYEYLGEERFLNYVDGVLFGNEAQFIFKCSGMPSFRSCIDFTQEKYGF